MIILHQY